MKIADRIGGFLLLAFAIYLCVSSRSIEYFTVDGVPGPGFLPFWISIILGIAAILVLVKSWSNPLSGPLIPNQTMLWRTAVFGLAIPVVALLIPFLGMILTLGLFILFAALLLGAKNWLHILAAGALVPTFVYFLFQVFLRLQLPVGPLRF